MSSHGKLNKIAKMYESASSKKKERKEGPGAEMKESVAEQAKEDREGTERHPAAAAKAKRSKKLDFNENRGGLHTTIYSDKEEE